MTYFRLLFTILALLSLVASGCGSNNTGPDMVEIMQREPVNKDSDKTPPATDTTPRTAFITPLARSLSTSLAKAIRDPDDDGDTTGPGETGLLKGWRPNLPGNFGSVEAAEKPARLLVYPHDVLSQDDGLMNEFEEIGTPSSISDSGFTQRRHRLITEARAEDFREEEIVIGTQYDLTVFDNREETDPTTDFLAFGYWLVTTPTSDGTTDLGVNVFVTGSDQYLIGDGYSQLTGQAVYDGVAGGQYVKGTGGRYTEGGAFTGDAQLTASFGGTSTSSTAEGSITNLVDASGRQIDSTWTVTLAPRNLVPHSSGAGVYVGTFGLGDTNGRGQWGADFYGNPATDTTPTDNYPEGVVGEFNANFSNGHVIGAFGATLCTDCSNP